MRIMFAFTHDGSCLPFESNTNHALSLQMIYILACLNLLLDMVL